MPAAYCGVVGLKPTYDLVSRQGVFPLSWSLDHVGPIARTASDAALLLRAMAGDRLGGAAARSEGSEGCSSFVVYCKDISGMLNSNENGAYSWYMVPWCRYPCSQFSVSHRQKGPA